MTKDGNFEVLISKKYRIMFSVLLIVFIALLILIISLSLVVNISSTNFNISYYPSFKELLLLVFVLYGIYKCLSFGILNQPYLVVKLNMLLYHNALLMKKQKSIDLLRTIELVKSKPADKILITTNTGKIITLEMRGATVSSEEVYMELMKRIPISEVVE